MVAAHLTLSTHRDLCIRNPVRRCYLIGEPHGHGLRWLGTHTRDGVGHVLQTINKAPCRVVGSLEVLLVLSVENVMESYYKSQGGELIIQYLFNTIVKKYKTIQWTLASHKMEICY